MLDFAIFAVTFVIILIITVIYLYPGSTRTTTIPGRDPSDVKEGNIPDISAAGGFHEFLCELHSEYGDIASFYYGTKLCVSLASVDLWKQHRNVFDKPSDLFVLFQPLIGENSIMFTNKGAGRSRRKLQEKCFEEQALKKYTGIFHETCQELVTKFKSLAKDEHIPLCQYMTALALKSLLKTAFGDYFNDPRAILELKKNFNICWHELEHRLTEGEAEDSSRQQQFDKAVDGLKTLFSKVIEQRKAMPEKEKKTQLLIDVLMECSGSEEQVINDAITYLLMGFHNTAYLLAWGLYYLASHKDVEDKVFRELEDVLGDGGLVNADNQAKLVYLHQVIKETLRCSNLWPWTARCQDIDVEIGGHVVPKNTPVVHALGVVLQDEKSWPLPNNFDPDRFSKENSEARDPLAFSPFGFAGQRGCPAAKYSCAEAVIVLAGLCKHFKWNMVEGQVVEYKYGLVSYPREEIWVTVEAR
ncbi:cytochrome P450 20A1-like [Ptychodera flava]|uniref:cytochrome P450 20A1-like n=1 Tax=Ptychodera flava TaxID=63121 RepID=UPI00396AA745